MTEELTAIEAPSIVRDIERLTLRSAELQTVETIPYLVLPKGYEVKSLEHLLDTPARKRGTISLRDADSFCAVVEAQSAESTRLYGCVNPPRFTAVFDDHGETAGWREHIARYDCPLSVEWKTWIGSDKRQMAQADFAQFIEDNAPDCVDPDAATMIEVSRSLQAKKKVSFASGIRLDNGQTELTYEEQIEGSAGAKGRLAVPTVFKLGIAVLEGGPKYEVTARLRYRIGDKGSLFMWYDLERSHKVLEHAVREVWQFIAEKTGLPVLNGE